MNGKNAKRLRKEALKQAVASGLPYVEYGFKQYRKVFTKLTGELVTYVVYTCYLEDSQKKLYHQLKKEFKQSV